MMTGIRELLPDPAPGRCAVSGGAYRLSPVPGPLSARAAGGEAARTGLTCGDARPESL